MTNSRWIFCFIVIVASVALTACQKSSGSGSPGSETPAPPTRLTGTSSGGGGGNGLDGKALELYSVDIESLPEYRRYVAPVIAKIAIGQSDVFAVYLKWVIRHKTWYMVNKDLQSLPKEQIGVTFDTEQLARHSEREVYIHAPTYYRASNTDSDRAELLMHEIVMGARLLMKKSPKEQCLALRTDRADVCSDKNVLASAQSPRYTKQEETIMDNDDTEAVRAMTVYLMHRTQEVTGRSVTAMRRQLKFIFPWDRLLSNLTPDDLIMAFRRTAKIDGAFVPSRSPRAIPYPDLKTGCLYDAEFAEAGSALRLSFVTASVDPVLKFDLEKATGGYSISPVNWLDDGETRFTFDGGASAWVELDGFSVIGIPDEEDPNRIVDQVTILPGVSLETAQQARPSIDPKIVLLISRGPEAKLLKMTAYDRKIVYRNADHDVKTKQDYELIADQKESFSCSKGK